MQTRPTTSMILVSFLALGSSAGGYTFTPSSSRSAARRTKRGTANGKGGKPSEQLDPAYVEAMRRARGKTRVR